MAFVNRISNVLKNTVSKHMNLELSASNPSLYQAIRSLSSSKLFVGGLSYGTDDMSLRDAFSQYGEVIEARIIMDRDTGRSRGFGFVTYTSSEHASSAIQALDGQDLHGRRIRVNYATEQSRGSGFRGGYGSRGGGYGGSGGYGTGGYGNAGYGGSYNYGGDANYNAGGGYGGGNYGSGGIDNSSGAAGKTDGFGGSSYGTGSGNFYSENKFDSNYSVGNAGGYGPDSTGGGSNYFSSASTHQGGFTTSEYDRNASTSSGGVEENFSANQVEPDAKEDFDQDSALEGNFKDDNDEPNDYANTRG